MREWMIGLLAAGLAAGQAAAEIVKVPAEGDVGAVTDALEAAVTEAGASVVARVDHAGAADGVGLEMVPAQLLVFGNPRLGTPAMQADPRAGLYLPLRVLVYEDAGGQVWLTYETPGAMLGELEIAKDAEVIGRMTGALEALTAKAAGG